eukprot:COSAG01_NODE_382_length_17840_cov_68.658663_14_plen_42_part_00
MFLSGFLASLPFLSGHTMYQKVKKVVTKYVYTIFWVRYPFV